MVKLLGSPELLPPDVLELPELPFPELDEDEDEDEEEELEDLLFLETTTPTAVPMAASTSKPATHPMIWKTEVKLLYV